MTYTLFLDDIRFPENTEYDYRMGLYNNVVICRSMDDAVWVVKQKGLPRFISFDHDLAHEHYIVGDGEKTGYTFAKWLGSYIIDNNLELPENFGYRVHSMNPVGAENIDKYMKNFVTYYINAAGM